MGSVIPLKKEIDNSYIELKNLVKDKLDQVNQRIKYKLASEINLIHKMTNYHLKSGGKRIRPLLTLGSAKLCGYTEGSRDINLAACVELIHSATLLHDDVIDKSLVRRGKKTPNNIWGNQSSILVGDYLLSRCFEIMVEDNDYEVLKLLSSTSSNIAQGEVLQLQHRGEIDMLEEIYLKIISSKTASLFAAATKVGGIITNKSKDEVFSENIWEKIEVENTSEDLLPFLITVPLQKLAYYSALKKGYDIDKPRNLAKSVTVE